MLTALVHLRPETLGVPAVVRPLAVGAGLIVHGLGSLPAWGPRCSGRLLPLRCLIWVDCSQPGFTSSLGPLVFRLLSFPSLFGPGHRLTAWVRRRPGTPGFPGRCLFPSCSSWVDCSRLGFTAGLGPSVFRLPSLPSLFEPGGVLTAWVHRRPGTFVAPAVVSLPSPF